MAHFNSHCLNTAPGGDIVSELHAKERKQGQGDLLQKIQAASEELPSNLEQWWSVYMASWLIRLQPPLIRNYLQLFSPAFLTLSLKLTQDYLSSDY